METLQLTQGITSFRRHGAPAAPRCVLVFGGFHFPRNCDAFMAELARRLGEGFQVVTYDYYGRGDSVGARVPYDEGLYLQQAEELIEGLGLSLPLDLLGFSFGGNVVARFAAADPARVRSLAISGPFGAWEPFLAPARWLPRLGLGGLLYRVYWQRLRAEIEKGFDEPERHTTIIDTMMAAETAIRDRDPEKLRGAILGTFRDFPSDTRRSIEALSGVAHPVLFVSGKRDCVCPIAHVRAMHAAVPHSSLVELEGNHNDVWLVEHQRESLLDALVSWWR